MMMSVASSVERQSETIRELTRRVRAEYAEMPGLSVTFPQAQRLLATDPDTCAAVLETLIKRRILRRTRRGRYIRA